MEREEFWVARETNTMGKLVLARSKWKARLEEKRKKKQIKMKKKALADSEFKKKMKELEKKWKEEEEKREEEKQWLLRQNAYIFNCEVKYWGLVWKSDGFDVDGLKLPSSHAMVATKCENPDDCPLIMRLYAKMGLHRYNMIHGTNLQLSCVERYNREGSFRLRAASYYITLRALDPATGDLVPFQASSHERTKDKLYVRFYVARPQYTGTVGELWVDKTAPTFDNISVPKWPSDEDDGKQFYMVQESEWVENDWIRLYLELGFVTTNRRIPNPKLSDLKIVEVMVETSKDHQTLEGFKDATVYIKYLHDLGDGRVCKRRAIIRRCVDLRTERMCLVGDDYLETESGSEHEASSKT